MYDRKKITLFVLLIATVILGGVSLFLATQINNNQSPDDSQAGNGSCLQRSGVSTSQKNCSLETSEANCKSARINDNLSNCCQLGSSNTCSPATGAPSYCSDITCSSYSPSVCGQGTFSVNPTCIWVPSATTSSCTVSGVSMANQESKCINGSRYMCNSGTATITGCCDGAVSQGGFCIPVSNNSCTQSGQTIAHNQTSCINNVSYRCNNGAVTNLGACTTGGSATCTEQGEEISHGNTACINGTNYTCNNGTATPGSSCGTTDPGTTPGGSTGSTCTPTLPIKAKLTGPGNNAVINSTTATLTWDRNGSWGVGCPENKNQFRIRVATVAASTACPTDTSNTGPYTRVGAIEGGPTGSFNLTVEDGMRYCWTIRKHNGSKAIDSGVRSFSVDIEEEVVDPGTNEDLTPGGEEVIDEEVVVPSPNTGGGAIAGDSTALPETAIVSDNLDPIILGMILVIIGLTLYKFDFGRKQEID